MSTPNPKAKQSENSQAAGGGSTPNHPIMTTTRRGRGGGGAEGEFDDITAPSTTNPLPDSNFFNKFDTNVDLGTAQ
jgi:hypothetical protein